MNQQTALTVTGPGQLPALQNAIGLWADATTDPQSGRRLDLLRDKTRAVAAFFTWCGKPPQAVTPIDVKAWQAELEARGLAPATVYAAISRLSSWYTWAMTSPELARAIYSNPATLARPKAPKPYQTEATQALDDDQVRALLQVVRARAAAGDVVGKRDLALLLFYLATGMRRREVIGLRWGDVKMAAAGLVITTRVKGGDLLTRHVDDGRVRTALLDYLEASGRLGSLAAGDPLWVAHDRRGGPPAPLTSHAFAKNLKRYAAAAGLGKIHLHQTRHTYARLVSEDTGSMTATQEALGHRNLATTRVYVRRVAVKPDGHSRAILDRLGV